MTTRDAILRSLLASAQADPRIVAAVDYGSSAAGRADQWSDLDLVLFVRDADQPAVAANWKLWAEGLGPLLLAYQAGGSPRAIYDAIPAPLRVDLAFFKESRIAEIPTWTNVGPTSVASMVLFDRTGTIAALAAGVVNAPAAVPDLAGQFEHVSGDLWNYLLRVYALTRREQWLAARTEYHWYVLDNLAALTRLEAGQLGRWRMTFAMNGVQAVVSPERYAALTACVPGEGNASLLQTAGRAAHVGHELCTKLARERGWPYAPELAKRVLGLFQQ